MTPHRSWIFVPGHRESMLAKVPGMAADCVILDLEDSVPPADKPAARASVAAQVETLGRTGVEMEALTAVQIGLLTIYDMCKAADRGMVMGEIKVLEKHGGKSGDWVAA